MSVPEWWSFFLIAAAAWRTFQLLGDDDILERPRAWVLARLDEKWDLFITCPYCAGFWIFLAWWGAWQATAFWTEVAASIMAGSAAVVALHKVLAREDEKP